MSEIRYPTSIWINSQIENPIIDFDSNKVYLEDESLKLKLYEAYSILRESRKLESMISIKEVVNSLYLESSILTEESLRRTLEANNEKKLEMFAKKDFTKLLNLLVSIGNSRDFIWAITVISRTEGIDQDVQSLDKETTMGIAAKLLNSLNGYGLDVHGERFFQMLYHTKIQPYNNIQIDFFKKDDIKNIIYIKNMNLETMMIEDFIKIFPNKPKQLKEYFLDHIWDKHPNIKRLTTIRKQRESERSTSTREVDSKVGHYDKLSDTSERGILTRSSVLTISLILVCIAAIFAAIFIFPSHPTTQPTPLPINLSVTTHLSHT